jgi:hypothetical protein
MFARRFTSFPIYCFGRSVSLGSFIVSAFIRTLLFLGGNWFVIFAEPAVPLALV